VSDLNSRQAGESGLDLPAGGNLDDWQAGKSIRDWNNAELERQRTAGSIPLPALAGMVVMHFFLTKRPLGLLKRVVGS